MKHWHHIIPEHIGGTDDPSNLVELTIEEHSEAHRVLYETYGRLEDKMAWMGLSKMISTQDIIQTLMTLNNPSKRPEERAYISQRMKGNKNASGKKSEEHKRKIGLANKGKLKGRVPWNKGLKSRVL
jgi:hypothetical protein